MVIVDRFSTLHFFTLRLYRHKYIKYIDIKRLGFSAVLCVLLQFIGYKIEKLDFQIGELEKKYGQNLTAGGILLNDSLSKEIANQIVKKYDLLQDINNYSEKNIIHMIVAKYFFAENYKLCWNIKIIRLLYPNATTYLAKTVYFEHVKTLVKYENAGFTFYVDIVSCIRNSLFKLLLILKRIVQRYQAQLISYFKSPSNEALEKTLEGGPIVFSFLEDLETSEKRFRNTFFWKSDASSDCKTASIGPGSERLESLNHIDFNMAFYGRALRGGKQEVIARELKSFKCRLLLHLIRPLEFFNISLWLHLLFVLINSEKMSTLFSAAHVNKFVFKETYGVPSDSILLFSKKMSIETIWIQYAVCTVPNLNMQTLADKCLIFSDKYQKIYSNEFTENSEFVVTGYPFRQMRPYMEKHANRLRRQLYEKGAKYLIGYFDENAFDSKYSMITKKDSQHEIETLARAVLANDELGVILKPQFVKNAVSQQMADVKVVKQAFNTGRFVELCVYHGDRNAVLPGEVALSCDVCIGNLVGGTASLEAAIFGVKSIFINPYNLRSHLFQTNSPKHLIFSDLEDALDSVLSQFNNGSCQDKVGSWGALLAEEDPFDDNDSFKRITDCILDKDLDKNHTLQEGSL